MRLGTAIELLEEALGDPNTTQRNVLIVKAMLEDAREAVRRSVRMCKRKIRAKREYISGEDD